MFMKSAVSCEAFE